MSTWKPTAGLGALQSRAELNAQLRAFFAERKVLEIEVPVLGATAVSDPAIESISANPAAGQFLQSSPEYFMKRLLAAGSGAIYSLGKAFRQGEAGRRHNPEFTMLEWYRPAFDDHALMDEVEALLRQVLGLEQAERISYRDLFQRELNIDPHQASEAELALLAKQHIDVSWQDADRDTWLDLLMSHCIEPAMSKELLFVYDYPASQSALARVELDSHAQPVARRFEAYVGGVELANGYWELLDADEQAQRFRRDHKMRTERSQILNPLDDKLLAAMASGMPACAGVALGVDRLLMLKTGSQDISDVLAFPASRL